MEIQLKVILKIKAVEMSSFLFSKYNLYELI